MAEWISGRNPVYEILRTGRRPIRRLRLAEGIQAKDRIKQILVQCNAAGIPVESVTRRALDAIDPSHQGVALEVGPYPYAGLQDILERASQSHGRAFILILDTLQDPQNLGTLLRTAEAVGVQGVLLPHRHTATVTPAVVRASAGATEHLLIAQTNLARAIATLKEHDIWVVGLDASPEASHLAEVNLAIPLALVVGSEGQGMRRLVRESCDLVVSLPMVGRVESLNAAVAGSVALYLAFQARVP